jgi:CRISPR-associated protein Cst1
MDEEKIKIELTGNPFVDTGLGVIASLSKLDDINHLNLSHIKSVYGDGTQLVEWNSKLKAFSQIFGTNNPLYHPSLGFKKGVGPSDNNKFVYKSILEGLLSEIGKSSNGRRCWSCGSPTDFDFIEITSRPIEKIGKKPPEEKYLGRDWFPLAGSLGSDAQALPAASLPPHICPKCLFAIHYLPLGLISLEGKPSVVQCTSTEYWYDFIYDIVEEVRGRVQSGKYETLGTKESKSRTMVTRLLKWFNHLQAEKKKFSKDINMYIWRFSNSGASPDCSIEEIPNPALAFLWDATSANLGMEIESLLRDENDPRNSLYQCILAKRDYPYLYPIGRRSGASPKFFNMYQTEICGHSSRALQVAQKLADGVVEGINDKELKRIQRPEAFKEERIKNQFRAAMIDMAEKGEFTRDDYLDLFPMKKDNGNGISVEWGGWNLIRFYLYHLNEDGISEGSTKKIDDLSPVVYSAGAIYNNYLHEKGSDRFKREVLGKMRLGKISASWLSNQFAKLSEMDEVFNYDTWSQLCKYEDKIYTKELLFQMRLLWTQWMFENRSSVILSVPQYDVSNNGLPECAENLLKAIFDDYINRKGLELFHRNILLRLHKGELGLYWFKKKFTAQALDELAPYTEEEWEKFLMDDEGRSIKFERLLQLHLALSNLYRLKLKGALT